LEIFIKNHTIIVYLNITHFLYDFHPNIFKVFAKNDRRLSAQNNYQTTVFKFLDECNAKSVFQSTTAVLGLKKTKYWTFFIIKMIQFMNLLRI
jgi:hypothetical protein